MCRWLSSLPTDINLTYCLSLLVPMVLGPLMPHHLARSFFIFVLHAMMPHFLAKSLSVFLYLYSTCNDGTAYLAKSLLLFHCFCALCYDATHYLAKYVLVFTCHCSSCYDATQSSKIFLALSLPLFSMLCCHTICQKLSWSSFAFVLRTMMPHCVAKSLLVFL